MPTSNACTAPCERTHNSIRLRGIGVRAVPEREAGWTEFKFLTMYTVSSTL